MGPTKFQPVMVWNSDEGVRELRAMKWGLVPVWSKSSTPHPCPVNARAETIHEKNTFRRLVDTRRCVILADGYFEWKRSGAGQGPYFFTPGTQTTSKTEIKSETCQDSTINVKSEKVESVSGSFADSHPMLRMAGLYDIWHNPETGEKLYSYTVLTVFASKLTSTIHDRMPALLWSEEDVDLWLNPANPYSKVKHLLVPSETLVIWPVSEIVGNVKNDTPTCIKPIDRKKEEKKLITSFFKPQTKVKSEPESASSSQTTLPTSWATEDLNESLIDEFGNPVVKSETQNSIDAAKDDIPPRTKNAKRSAAQSEEPTPKRPKRDD